MSARMGRPRLKDRRAVKSVLVTLKLSQEERDMLDRLVEARAADLRAETHGAHVDVTASSYLRWLIARDAESRGLARRGAPGVGARAPGGRGA